MRLSFACFFKKTVPGHIFRGKRRLVKEVKIKDMKRLVRDYELQEKNMLYLRHPFLTKEESNGHVKAMNKDNNYLQKLILAQLPSKMKPHITIEERLHHLKIKDVWD